MPGPRASAAAWASMITQMQKAALSTRLGVPIIYGIDALHGHNNVYGATIFPHNVGLGATRLCPLSFPHNYTDKSQSSYDFFFLLEFIRDPKLVMRIGAATALEVRATGIQHTYAPCLAVEH